MPETEAGKQTTEQDLLKRLFGGTLKWVLGALGTLALAGVLAFLSRDFLSRIPLPSRQTLSPPEGAPVF